MGFDVMEYEPRGLNVAVSSNVVAARDAGLELEVVGPGGVGEAAVDSERGLDDGAAVDEVPVQEVLEAMICRLRSSVGVRILDAPGHWSPLTL
jgi:hypothetical protein